MKNSKPSNGSQFDFQKEQEKELKRIKSFIKNAENRGYKFYDVKIPKSLQMKEGFNEFSVPKKVKNPTQKTIDRLKKIDPDYLYERALYVDQKTGDVLRGSEARRLNRSRSAKKSSNSSKHFNNFTVSAPRIPPPESNLNLDIIEKIRVHISDLETITYGPPEVVQYKHDMGRYLEKWYEEIVGEQEDYGDIYEYAAYLNSKAVELNHYLDEAVRTSKQDEVRYNLSGFMAIVNRGPLTPEQSEAIAEYTFAMGYGYEEY